MAVRRFCVDVPEILELFFSELFKFGWSSYDSAMTSFISHIHGSPLHYWILREMMLHFLFIILMSILWISFTTGIVQLF